MKDHKTKLRLGCESSIIFTMPEYLIRGRTFKETGVVDDGLVIVEGERRITAAPTKEPTNPKYGFEVFSRKFIQPEYQNADFALAKIEAGSSCPPQLVLREGEIIDYPISGNAILISVEPGSRQTVFTEFNSEVRGMSRFKLQYGKGTYICWKAISDFELVEICQNPPYKEGDLMDLDLCSFGVPKSFAYECRRFGVV